MTSFENSFMFGNMGRIGSDSVDNTQVNIYNTKFSNYNLSNFYQENLSDAHVLFATNQPNVMFKGVSGTGLGSLVDYETDVFYKAENGRSLDKMMLMERPFLTVPYLGRGSCDPSLESQLLQGENVNDKKSVSTIMEQSFMNHSLYPVDDNMISHLNDTNSAALNGWVRGGAVTREASSSNN